MRKRNDDCNCVCGGKSTKFHKIGRILACIDIVLLFYLVFFFAVQYRQGVVVFGENIHSLHINCVLLVAFVIVTLGVFVFYIRRVWAKILLILSFAFFCYMSSIVLFLTGYFPLSVYEFPEYDGYRYVGVQMSTLAYDGREFEWFELYDYPVKNYRMYAIKDGSIIGQYIGPFMLDTEEDRLSRYSINTTDEGYKMEYLAKVSTNRICNRVFTKQEMSVSYFKIFVTFYLLQIRLFIVSIMAYGARKFLRELVQSVRKKPRQLESPIPHHI